MVVEEWAIRGLVPESWRHGCEVGPFEHFLLETLAAPALRSSHLVQGQCRCARAVFVDVVLQFTRRFSSMFRCFPSRDVGCVCCDFMCMHKGNMRGATFDSACLVWLYVYFAIMMNEGVRISIVCKAPVWQVV